MQVKTAASLIAVTSLMMVSAGCRSDASPKVSPQAIGGIVTGESGPEAGVWVIAETTDLGKRFAKIVVTDEKGRFVLPDLPAAKFKIWSRGYGLRDSAPVEATPGATVSLQASAAGSAQEAAQIYPANYWFSLIEVPASGEFGAKAEGGISPQLPTQQHWIAHMVENCQNCHQMGVRATRDMPAGIDPVVAWEQRIQKGRSPDDRFADEDRPEPRKDRKYGERMNVLMNEFGRQRGLSMFADWTTRIAEGEVPPTPPRPVGVERNIVLTLWEMGEGRFVHDSSSTDKRNPTLNAHGPVYGYATFSGMVMALDPKTGREEQFKLTDAKGDWFINGHPRTGTMDSRGRVWMTDMVQFGGVSLAATGPHPSFCSDPDNEFAKYFPRQAAQARVASVFDPRSRKDTLIPVCYGTQHLSFDWHSERLYFTGDTEVVGWLDVDVLDETRDPAQAVGWCPMVLDTNGDGRVTPDRTQWNERLDGILSNLSGQEVGEGKTSKRGSERSQWDPTKDTRITGLQSGVGVSPVDGSYWAARYMPLLPSGIVRLETGSNPPLTCKTEYYEPPKVNGEYRAYNIRGVDVDAQGMVWVTFGVGAIGKFDRSKCKVLNGPEATGQHCAEGWEIIPTPGPKFKGVDAGSDWFYDVFVDNHDTFGLGRGVPFFANSAGDELLAYVPEEKKFVHLRVPYPLNFYARLVDGRIDDPAAGWKGRGLWATNNLSSIWHQETGEGSNLYAVHFQLRPTPLAE